MKQYFYHSKNLAHSFLFILPLLVLYEVGIALQSSNVKNAADVAIKTPLALFGKNGSLIFNSLVIVFLFASVFSIEKGHRLNLQTFVLMFLESAAYALCIGYGLGFIVYQKLSPHTMAIALSLSNTWKGVILSVGAGVYEEIVFRLLLISALYFLFAAAIKINKPVSAVISAIVGAFIFAVAHYMGSLGDSFTSTGFLFRFLSGLVLSVIFMFRGLGIAVYTHAIYDVLSIVRPFHV